MKRAQKLVVEDLVSFELHQHHFLLVHAMKIRFYLVCASKRSYVVGLDVCI